MEKMFETALRKKYRFEYKGVQSVEDLWDLSVENLDNIYKGLNALKKVENTDSLLATKKVELTDLENKIEIVKHIVAVKLEEKQARLKASENKAKKEKILAMIASKNEEALQNKSVEELEAMLATVDTE